MRGKCLFRTGLVAAAAALAFVVGAGAYSAPIQALDSATDKYVKENTDPWAGATKPHITILAGENTASPAQSPERFVALQVFKADVGSTGDTLDNIQWGDSVEADDLVKAMANSTFVIGKHTTVAEAPHTPDVYQNITKFGDLFKTWLVNNVSAFSAAKKGDAQTGVEAPATGNVDADQWASVEGSLDSTHVTAHDVAQFLSEFGYVQGHETDPMKKDTHYSSPSPYTRSEVAAAFASLAAEHIKESGEEGTNYWFSRSVSKNGVTSQAAGGGGVYSGADKCVGWVISGKTAAAKESDDGLPAGYYMVFDRASSKADGKPADEHTFTKPEVSAAVSEDMLRVVGDEGSVLHIKSDVPTLTKFFTINSDENHLTAGVINANDSSSNVMHVVAKITLPENVGSYHSWDDDGNIATKKYGITYTDTLGASLDGSKSDPKIYVGTGSTDVTSGNIETIKSTLNDDNLVKGDGDGVTITKEANKVEVKLDNIFALKKAAVGNDDITIAEGIGDANARSAFFIVYDVPVTSEDFTSISGSTANAALKSSALMTYSSNPYVPEDTTNTVTVTEQVYNYGLTLKQFGNGKFEKETDGNRNDMGNSSFLIVKTDDTTPLTAESGAGLNGRVANFKNNGDSTYTLVRWANADINGSDKVGDFDKMTDEAQSGETDYQVITTPDDDANRGIVKLYGLADGYYSIIQLEAPKQQTVVDPFVVHIQNGSVTTANANGATVSVEDATNGGTLSQRAKVDTGAPMGNTGVATILITSVDAIDLPVTGGIGRTMIYVVGASCVAAWIAYMIWDRKRRSVDDMV